MISSCTYLQKRELRKIRTLPIPESVQAYQHIQFTVLSSMEEQECFLQSLSPRLEREWQPPVWRAFRSAIIDARIDYSTHALVLIPLHLGAIANNLHIGPAEIRGKRLIFLAGDGPSRDFYLPSVSHYCRAYESRFASLLTIVPPYSARAPHSPSAHGGSSPASATRPTPLGRKLCHRL
jgi:hypothetical protein